MILQCSCLLLEYKYIFNIHVYINNGFIILFIIQYWQKLTQGRLKHCKNYIFKKLKA